MPERHLEPYSLWENDKDAIYETKGGYLPAEASDDDYWVESAEEDIYREENQGRA